MKMQANILACLCCIFIQLSSTARLDESNLKEDFLSKVEGNKDDIIIIARFQGATSEHFR